MRPHRLRNSEPMDYLIYLPIGIAILGGWLVFRWWRAERAKRAQDDTSP